MDEASLRATSNDRPSEEIDLASYAEDIQEALRDSPEDTIRTSWGELQDEDNAAATACAQFSDDPNVGETDEEPEPDFAVSVTQSSAMVATASPGVSVRAEYTIEELIADIKDCGCVCDLTDRDCAAILNHPAFMASSPPAGFRESKSLSGTHFDPLPYHSTNEPTCMFSS